MRYVLRRDWSNFGVVEEVWSWARYLVVAEREWRGWWELGV